MILALELSPQNLTLVGLALSTAGAFAYGFVQKRRGARAAKVARAIAGGVKRGLDQHFGKDHEDVFDSILDATYEFARELDVPEDHVDEHLLAGDLTKKDGAS